MFEVPARCAECDAELLPGGQCPFLAAQWHAATDDLDVPRFVDVADIT
jgi:hypothetical protein